MRPGLSTLRAVPMFERLDAGLLNQLDAISEFVRVDPQAVLCVQGEAPAVLHILMEGQAALSATASDGSHTVVEVVHPVSSFVLAAVLTELPYLMTATAITACRVLTIRAPALRALVRTEHRMALALLGAVSRDFRGMVRQVRDLKLRTAAQRLGCYLIALVDDDRADNARLRLPFEKGLLAARLGCRQDSLSRAFATLREVGVETHGLTVVLHDISRLRAFAMPDELSDAPLPG